MVELPSPSAKCDLLRECSVGVISAGGVGGGRGRQDAGASYQAI